MSEQKKKALIVEGGGFKTAFTTGVLDSFLEKEYNPFDLYYGISGGAIAISYYLSEQKEDCYKAHLHMTEAKNFTKLSRIFSKKGMMDIDYMDTIASNIFPFDVETAVKNKTGKEVYFVASNKLNGKPAYLSPDENLWVKKVIASCTLPFVTKGTQYIEGTPYFDGGWSDPIPVKQAYEKGARHVTILRTYPRTHDHQQTWPNYLGSKLNRSKVLRGLYANMHNKINEGLAFALNPPSDLVVDFIDPKDILASTITKYSVDSIKTDYQNGKQTGFNYLDQLKK